jgi:hypothetical protein
MPATETTMSKFTDTFQQHSGIEAELTGKSFDEQSASRAAGQVVIARRRVGDSLEAIDKKAQRMIDDLQRVQTNARAWMVGERGSINSLGELQGQAVAFDIECAKVDERLQALNLIEYALGIED